MFKEPAIRVPSLVRLREIAQDTGLDVPESDLGSYQSKELVYHLNLNSQENRLIPN